MKALYMAQDSVIRIKRNRPVVFSFFRINKNVRKIKRKKYAAEVATSFIRRDDVKNLHGGTLCGVLKNNSGKWVVLLNENATTYDLESAVETLANMEEKKINNYKKNDKNIIPLIAF